MEESKGCRNAAYNLKSEISQDVFEEWGEDYCKSYLMGIIALRQLGALCVGLEDRAGYNIGNEPEGLILASNTIKARMRYIEDSAEEWYDRILNGEDIDDL